MGRSADRESASSPLRRDSSVDVGGQGAAAAGDGAAAADSLGGPAPAPAAAPTPAAGHGAPPVTSPLFRRRSRRFSLPALPGALAPRLLPVMAVLRNMP